MAMLQPGTPWRLANPGAPYAPEPVKQEKLHTDCEGCGAPLAPAAISNRIECLNCRRVNLGTSV